MATVPSTTKNSGGVVSPAAIALATSGDILTYVPNQGDELYLYNTSGSTVVVTIDGANGTTVAVPGAAGATLSVAAGLAVTVLAGTFAMVPLDKASAYLQGVVAISAATGAVVKAAIVTQY